MSPQGQFRPAGRYTTLPILDGLTPPRRVLERDPRRRGLIAYNPGTGDVQVTTEAVPRDAFDVWILPAGASFSFDSPPFTHNGPLYAWGAAGHDLVLAELLEQIEE